MGPKNANLPFRLENLSRFVTLTHLKFVSPREHVLHFYTHRIIPCNFCLYLMFYRCVVTDPSLRILMAGGPPMHLGFVIHVFLHFLVTHKMMIRVSRTNESLVDETTASDLTEPLLHDTDDAATE